MPPPADAGEIWGILPTCPTATWTPPQAGEVQREQQWERWGRQGYWLFNPACLDKTKEAAANKALAFQRLGITWAATVMQKVFCRGTHVPCCHFLQSPLHNKEQLVRSEVRKSCQVPKLAGWRSCSLFPNSSDTQQHKEPLTNQVF